MSKKSDRKLAVILFADIAGYTALMQENESLALDMLQKFKTTIHQKISEYGGDIIQYFGDGYLIAFESSTQGVKCALELQNSFHLQHSLPVRIGMHLGEVLFREENVFGDGVNIASRIESIGVPGSVLFSKAIRDQISNKEDFSITSLGSFEFKNVKEPVEVYALNNDGLVVPDRRLITGKLKDTKSSFLKNRGVQALLVFINIMVVALLSMWYFNSKNNTSPIITDGNKYVLAIGIDNNPNWLRLYNAKNDAIAVVDLLKEYFGFQSLTEPLINESATKDRILNSVDAAKNILKEDDQLLVFYAGHGYSEIGEGNPEGYIVPYDGPGEESGKSSGYIKISDFLKEVSELPARHITTIFDACYSGFAIQDQIRVLRGSSTDLKEVSKIPSRKVFSSADHDQQAADSGPIAEHSLFTGFLIEGLRTGQADMNSDKIITMSEIAIFLERNIESHEGSNQTPRYGSYKKDKGGEMLLEYNDVINRVDTKISKLLQQKEDEIYTAVPFRTSTALESYPELKTYLPAVVLESLSELTNKKYKVVIPNLITMSDSLSTNFRISDLLNPLESTKYFAGRYEVLDDELIIKISLHDSENDHFIYSFPEIKEKLSTPKPIQKISLKLKGRVMGFMDNNEHVIDKLTLPPDYSAYKELKRAYQTDCTDRKTLDKHIDKAISIDPGYFRAYLYKAFSYVNCREVNVSKALNEWRKFKDIEFELSDYEEERFSLFEHELRGNYEALVQSKYNLFKDYKTRKVFNDAVWHAIVTKNFSIANEIFKIAESLPQDSNFRKDIFIKKNMMEHHLEPGEKPKYYDRYAREEELIKYSFRYYFPSKLLFGCQTNCVDEVVDLLKIHNEDKWDWYILAGNISTYNGEEEVAKEFYLLAKEKIMQQEKPEPDDQIIYNYKLKNFDRCVSIGESNLDSLVSKMDFSGLRYYILAKQKLGQNVENINFLMDQIYQYENFPGYGAYYLATIKCHEGKFSEANALLKRAFENGLAFTPYRYNFDPDLKPMWDDPEFIAFTRPK